MYTFQDIDVVNSAWDVLSLAAIFLVGVYIALAGYRHHRVPQGLALLMYFWHTISNVGQVMTRMGVVVTVTAAALDMTPNPGQVCVN